MNLKKIKVLFAIYNLGVGGAERTLVNLLDNLDKNFLEPVCIFYDSRHTYLSINDIKSYNLKAFEYGNTFERIAKIIDMENPDIVCGFLTGVNIATVSAAILSKKTPKIIVSERSTPSLFLSGRRHKEERLSIKHFYPLADVIIAVSNGVKKDLVNNFGIPEKKIKVIHNGVDIKKVRKLAKETLRHPWFIENVPIIINVSSLRDKKNHSCLLMAFKIVKKKVKSRLVILGEGEEKNKLKKLSIELGIHEDVSFLGYQKNPYKFIAKSSIFVLSSLCEGFPNVLLEAMACGIPIVSTNCKSGPNEIIQNGINGILVPTKNENKMSEAIMAILRDSALAKKLSTHAMQTVKKFSIEKMVKKYSKIFLSAN